MAQGRELQTAQSGNLRGMIWDMRLTNDTTATADELTHYRRVMADSPDFKLFPGVKPIAISAANFDKLLSEGRSFDEYFHYLEEQNYIDAQSDLLQPEEIETLSEADEAETPPEVNGAEAETVTEEQPTEPALEEPATKQENPANQPDTTNHAPKHITPAEKPENDPALMGSEGDDPLFDDD